MRYLNADRQATIRPLCKQSMLYVATFRSRKKRKRESCERQERCFDEPCTREIKTNITKMEKVWTEDYNYCKGEKCEKKMNLYSWIRLNTEHSKRLRITATRLSDCTQYENILNNPLEWNIYRSNHSDSVNRRCEQTKIDEKLTTCHGRAIKVESNETLQHIARYRWLFFGRRSHVTDHFKCGPLIYFFCCPPLHLPYLFVHSSICLRSAINPPTTPHRLHDTNLAITAVHVHLSHIFFHRKRRRFTTVIFKWCRAITHIVHDLFIFIYASHSGIWWLWGSG